MITRQQIETWLGMMTQCIAGEWACVQRLNGATIIPAGVTYHVTGLLQLALKGYDTMTDKNYWNETRKITPPDCEVVETKIDDIHGERNIRQLQRKGNLWFTPDGMTYVYYTPSHWRSIEWQGEFS